MLTVTTKHETSGSLAIFLNLDTSLNNSCDQLDSKQRRCRPPRVRGARLHALAGIQADGGRGGRGRGRYGFSFFVFFFFRNLAGQKHHLTLFFSSSLFPLENSQKQPLSTRRPPRSAQKTGRACPMAPTPSTTREQKQGAQRRPHLRNNRRRERKKSSGQCSCGPRRRGTPWPWPGAREAQETLLLLLLPLILLSRLSLRSCCRSAIGSWFLLLLPTPPPPLLLHLLAHLPLREEEETRLRASKTWPSSRRT